jgi:hypothetical protein
MSGEDAPRPYLENLIVLEIKTNKQINCAWASFLCCLTRPNKLLALCPAQDLLLIMDHRSTSTTPQLLLSK